MDWHAVRTPWAICSQKLTFCSNASSYPFKKTHQPFERLKLSVRKKSSAVRMARAVHSRKLISRLNGSSSPFQINQQPFERLELSVREIQQPLKRLKLSVRKSNSFAVRMARAKKLFLEPVTFHKQSSRTFLFFVYLRLKNLIPVATFLAKKN